MKITNTIITTGLACVAALAVVSCSESDSDSVKDSVNDALDNRPAEETQDAIEDGADKLKDIVE